MAESINLRLPIRVFGADGTVLFTGFGLFGIVYTCRVTLAATPVALNDAIALDTAAVIIPGGSFVGGVDQGVVPEAIYAVRKLITPAPGDKALGVALSVGAVGQEIVVAGPGSIALVNVAAGIGTAGQHANPGGTLGQCVSAAAAIAQPGIAVGNFLVKAGTTGGSTDTGNNTKACVIVMPHSA